MGAHVADSAALRRLFATVPVAALGTLHRGEPAVSMVPFVLPSGHAHFVIHVSALATHTRDMHEHPRVSMLFMGPWQDGASAQALPRVAVQAQASFLPSSGDPYLAARDAYNERFPDAAPTFALEDFSIALLHPLSARLVAGFGRAYSLVGPALLQWLRG
jgi:putative heme iron utilization protein